jgi:two-component system chemotaxis response regulator CheB
MQSQVLWAGRGQRLSQVKRFHLGHPKRNAGKRAIGSICGRSETCRPISRFAQMARSDLFVIGGSAGAIDALRTIIGGLPDDFPSAICVVVHVAADSPGVLPQILSRSGSLRAVLARHGQKLTPGCIHVAPPDHHLLLDGDDTLQLGHGPKENRFRPAIDPLFRSAALNRGSRVTGVILTGGLDDGVAGLAAIKQFGGGAIVQDPQHAEAPSLPRAALRAVNADRVLRVGQIAEAMIEFSRSFEPVAFTGAGTAGHDAKQEVSYARGAPLHLDRLRELGDPSLFTCPDCHGALIRVKGAEPARFRCHTGHAYTLESLVRSAGERVEFELWDAVRALEEYAALHDQAATAMSKDADAVRRHEAEADLARARGDVLRKILVGSEAAGLSGSTQVDG